MDIRHSDLILISEALATQIRLLEARVVKTPEDSLRLLKFKDLKQNIDDLLLRQ